MTVEKIRAHNTKLYWKLFIPSIRFRGMLRNHWRLVPHFFRKASNGTSVNKCKNWGHLGEEWVPHGNELSSRTNLIRGSSNQLRMCYIYFYFIFEYKFWKKKKWSYLLYILCVVDKLGAFVVPFHLLTFDLSQLFSFFSTIHYCHIWNLNYLIPYNWYYIICPSNI